MTADMVQQLQLGDDARGFAQDTPNRLDVNAATVMADAAGHEPVGVRQVAAALDARAAAAGFAGEIGTVA